ncbi:MAG: bifunctional UDP-N-acetylmuramoyl-tripeptide:D-alanyl-D-alanine ligase/alanine racemase [Bacteroidales bacterium]|nr:bifunctional UDP-N-acetylmuramoyl-tripeptide:D-alanyl-D-alanine ligase/alanine racemase [Bacteroidales bacterium]MBN2756523.1 bifunctional UDP-N-acetylmuramoyl-tripeptide:D-alanyl-D-alanine ligase/alanine racemase [Bacteroidales bacterium]
MNYSFEKISEITDSEIIGNKKTIISKIIIDSRSFVYDNQTLFVAIKGERNNGHDYINELYNNGILNFLVQDLPQNYKLLKNANFLIVKNSLNAFQQIAEYHRNTINYPIVGITGSNGKTIIKEWIFQVLNNEKLIIRNPKSYNSQVGVPLSLILLEKNYDFGIFEAGISKLNEMNKLQKMINPNIGIFTNIGDAHQENFESIEQKIKEKLELFKKSEILIYCKNHANIHNLISTKSNTYNLKTFTWSNNSDSDLFIDKIENNKTNTKISAIFKTKKIEIEIPFSDKASIENAIHVWSFLLVNELFSSKTKENFKHLTKVAMRLEMIKGKDNCTLINDSYNSDLNSIQIAIDVLEQQNQNRIKSIILSDIEQSGKKEYELYKTISEIINKSNIQKIVGIGKNISNNFELFTKEKYFFNTTAEFLQSKIIEKFSDEAILIKGSRDFGFEKIIELLQKKNHRTQLEINLEALTHNLNYFKSLLNKKTKIMIMVKAFSYGSGSHEIAGFLQHQKVDYLGVAYTDEGIELRKAGINLPIMVMNPDFENFSNIIEYKLEPEIYDFNSLIQFNKVASQQSVNAYPVHIKIDTGMKRLGFEKKNLEKLISEIQKSKSIIVKSVFSHLAASDEAVHDKFTQTQISDFKHIADEIEKTFGYKFLRHILNSSGIERFPEAQFEMVRLGIGLYGISSQNQDKLQNISTLKTRISQIKTIKADESVGYSRKGRVNKETKIAILPIGYADGLNRALSNGNGNVLINNKLAPFIGNICMDMCMVDLSGIEANQDDEVIIFGQNKPITEIAEKLNTIPYEILTSISQRVKRIYIH